MILFIKRIHEKHYELLKIAAELTFFVIERFNINMKISSTPIIKYTKKIANEYTSRLDYTYQHKKAYLKVEKQFLGVNTLTGYLHDTNKLLMYALCFPKKWVKNIHRALASHHERNGKIKDVVGAIIDWESAKYTKADKPLSAREIFEKEYSHVKGVDEMLKKFGL